MTRWLFIAAIAVLLPCMGLAETVTLRSGEHDDFSRLVAFLPGKPDWRVKTSGRTVEIIVSGTEQYDFDTSAIFDRIPKTRIAAVAMPQPNRLSLELGCECIVNSFFQAPRMLVIDVKDASGARALRNRPVPEVPDAMREVMGEALKQRSTYSTTGIRKLAEALATDTTRNVLELRLSGSARPSGNIGVESDFLNINVPNIANRVESSTQENSASCDALARMPLGNYDKATDFASEKGRLTAGLYTENLALDRKVAIELAQFYLSQGFGAEARQVVSMADDSRDGATYLIHIASLIDDPEAVTRADLTPFEACSQDNMLWSVLGGPQPGMEEAAARRVARKAEALPRPLLHAIAPHLIANLIESGRTEAADLIARSIGRSGGYSEISMADVLLVEDEGTKEEILREIVRTNGEDAAEATALLVERRVEMGEMVPVGLSELAASHAQEQRHGDSGAMLRKAEAFSLISRGEFEPAVAVIESDALDDPGRTETVAHLFRELARSADTITFLKIALSKSALAATTPEDVRQSVAARLYENKFSDTAVALVDHSGPLGSDLVTSALSARLFGEVGIPDDRLFVEADSDPEADELRYRALLSSGRFAEARQVALALGRTDPVDALLSLDRPYQALNGEAEAEAGRSLAYANALTDSTATLAQTVTQVLSDPSLELAE